MCAEKATNKDANVALLTLKGFKVNLNETRWRKKKEETWQRAASFVVHTAFTISRHASSLVFSIYPTNCIMVRRDLPKVCNSANLVCHVKWTVTFTVERARARLFPFSEMCCRRADSTHTAPLFQGIFFASKELRWDFHDICEHPLRRHRVPATTTKLVSDAERNHWRSRWWRTRNERQCSAN